jgi:alanine racemase
MPIVKADAYGHGAEDTVRTLLPYARLYGVANCEEASALRHSFPEIRIFLLGPALPSERATIARAGFIPAVSSLGEAKEYACEVRTHHLSPLEVHLAIDTGMGRIGVWKEEALETARAIAALPELRLSGVATHLPVADEDSEFTQKQLSDYRELARRIKEALPNVRITHALHSAGLLGFSEFAPDIVRAGLALYGASPLPAHQDKLLPVMTAKTRVTLVRKVGAGRTVSYGRTFTTPAPMTHATLAIGYADGYPRILSNRNTEVLIHGTRCPVLGRVTMDQIIVDVSHLSHVEPGDEAVLLGRQDQEEIPASELAGKALTIPWEIFTGWQGRMKRYHYDPES